jgi:uncharacterized membrane protein YdbT with pleckstrin-like domain
MSNTLNEENKISSDNTIHLNQSAKIDIINYLILIPSLILGIFYYFGYDIIGISKDLHFELLKTLFSNKHISYFFFFIVAFNIINILLRKYYYHYEISKTGVKSRFGILNVKHTQIRYEAIRTVTFHQNVIQMILNIGDVEIASSELKDTVIMKNIDNPKNISLMLEEVKKN